MDVLIAFYIFCICSAELMGSKTFAITHIGSYALNGSISIFLIPFIYTINDVIVEVYGVERARSIIRSGIFVIVAIIFFSLIAVSLPPSTRFKNTEVAYDTIFFQSTRISIASLIAIVVAEFTDVLVFQKLRKKLHSKGLWLRNNVSNIISLFLDTSIFMILAFYAPNISLQQNYVFLSSLILPYWLLKCTISVFTTPFVYLGVKWLKNNPDE